MTALLFLPWFYSVVSRMPLPPSWYWPITLMLIFILLSSVALHELGHTLVAQRYNIRVQDIVLTPIGGVARMAGALEQPRHEIRVALAGPYVSLFLCMLGFLLGAVFLNMEWLLPAAFFRILGYMNLMLCLFNLLPSFPMDGGRVLRGWLAQRKGMLEATRIASSLGKFLAIGFFMIGLSDPNRRTLIIIGIFIFMAAGSEYRMMKLRAWQEQTFGIGGMPTPDSPQVEVSPPPYAAQKPRIEADGLLGDVVQTARDLVSEIFSAGRTR